MKRGFVIVSISLLFMVGVSCVSNNTKDEQGMQTMEEDLSQIKKEISAQYESTIQTINKELDTMKERYERLVEDTKEKAIDEAQGDVDSYELDGREYLIYTRGADKLEDGVVVVLESYDEQGQLSWMHAFNGIQVTELSIYSGIAVRDAEVIVRVGRNLYAFDLQSGDEKFIVSDVGQSGDTPLIGEDGILYIRGQYAPFVMAIAKSGDVLWVLDDERYIDIESIDSQGDGLVITGDGWVDFVDDEGEVTTQE